MIGSRASAEPGQSVRALLVGDEALVAMFAEEVLSGLGFRALDHPRAPARRRATTGRGSRLISR